MTGDSETTATEASPEIHAKGWLACDFFEALGPGIFYWLAAFNLTGVLTAHSVMTRVGSVAVFKDDSVLALINTHVAAGEEMFFYPYHPIYYFLPGSAARPAKPQGMSSVRMKPTAQQIVLIDRLVISHYRHSWIVGNKVPQRKFA